MEGSTEQQTERSWLRSYRCWSQNLEVQVHYEGIHRIDPQTGERAEVVDELQEAVVQCLDCMHDQPHLGFHNGRVEPIEDRWERMVAGTPWVASCTVTVDGDAVETCSGPEAGDALSYAAFGDHDQVAAQREVRAAADAVAVHLGDHRLRGAPQFHVGVHVAGHELVVDDGVPRAVGLGVHDLRTPLDVVARAERATGAAQADRTHLGIGPGALEIRPQVVDQLGSDRVQAVGTVEREGRHAVRGLVQNGLRHGRAA